MATPLADRVTLTDAALRLGVSYWRTREMVLRGQLRGGKAGRVFWVDAEDLERVASQRESVCPPTAGPEAVQQGARRKEGRRPGAPKGGER